MRRTGRIPVQVEPLDEERFTNIERRLVIGVSELSATPARGAHRYVAFAGAALAMAAAAVIGWKLRGTSTPVSAVTADQHLAVRTEGERTTLALDDATIIGEPATTFDIARGDGRIVVQMTRGKLELTVQHHPGRLFVIRAGDTEIEDVGTRFSVDYDGKDHVDVRVTEGEVKVTRHQQAVRIAAGNAWTTTTGPIALAELDRPVVATVEPPVRIEVSPSPSPSPKSEPLVAHRPLAAKPLAPARLSPEARSPKPEARPEARPDLRVAIHNIPIEFDPRIDGHADASAEIGRLKKLAYSATVGPDASRALYQIAVLLVRPLGQDAEALHTLDWYFRRFTGGKEMHAALWLRVRILCSHAIDDECRKASYSYQQEVETGAAAEVAIRITNAQ